MSQPNLDYFRKRNLLLKKETTEGTDAIPTGVADAIRLFDGSSSTEMDKVDRKLDRSFFGGDAFAVANLRAKIDGNFELYPPATPGAATTSDADCGLLLMLAGMAVTKTAVAKTTVYNPISAGQISATGYWYHSGTLIKALGSRADISGLMIEIGNRMMGKIALTGTYADVSSAAAPTVTLPSTVPVVARHANSKTTLSTLVKGGTASSAGTPLSNLTCWAKSLSVDFGNDLKHKEYTSKAINGISDRVPKWTLKLAQTDISADFNPWFVRDSGILVQAGLTLFDDDAQNGLYSKLAIRGQIESIAEEDIDGDYGWTLSGPCIPSAAGGDELYVEFGDASP